jgi:hypothetical protein
MLGMISAMISKRRFFPRIREGQEFPDGFSWKTYGLNGKEHRSRVFVLMYRRGSRFKRFGFRYEFRDFISEANSDDE